jgi:hypothetical protein
MSRSPIPGRITDPHYLARTGCKHCDGFGKRKEIGTCPCIFRAVTALCVESLHTYCCVHPNYRVFTRRAEYSAELNLIALHTLTARELVIWRRYFVDAEPWHLIDEETRLGRGAFFHAVYRIAENMGRELSGSVIWPPSCYFAGLSHQGLSMRAAKRHTPARKTDKQHDRG